MFFRLFFLFAVLALAFANPKPEPQFVSYSAPLVAPGAYAYNAPLAYSAGYAYPYGYSGYYVR